MDPFDTLFSDLQAQVRQELVSFAEAIEEPVAILAELERIFLKLW